MFSKVIINLSTCFMWPWNNVFDVRYFAPKLWYYNLALHGHGMHSSCRTNCIHINSAIASVMALYSALVLDRDTVISRVKKDSKTTSWFPLTRTTCPRISIRESTDKSRGRSYVGTLGLGYPPHWDKTTLPWLGPGWGGGSSQDPSPNQLLAPPCEDHGRTTHQVLGSDSVPTRPWVRVRHVVGVLTPEAH
jgi:hypothetical protein